MAATTKSDFKLYPEQVQAGMNEVLAQNAQAFNGASSNAIRFFPQALPEDYAYEAFFQSISGLVTRRKTDTVSAVTDLELTQDEFISVKVNRRIGPVKIQDDAFYKAGLDPQEASFILGTQAGQAMQLDYLNTGLVSAVNAIRNVDSGALETDQSGASPATLTHGHLITALSTFGDRADRIVCWVMHSKPYFDLMGQAYTDKITDVANVAIYEGTTGTVGRRVVVTDSTALIDSSTSPDEYVVLGLTQGALDVIQSEPARMVDDLITGEENIARRFQGEHAYNLRLKGFKWDVSNGGENPSDTALGTSGYWDKAATDNRDLAGLALVVQ